MSFDWPYPIFAATWKSWMGSSGTGRGESQEPTAETLEINVMKECKSEAWEKSIRWRTPRMNGSKLEVFQLKLTAH